MDKWKESCIPSTTIHPCTGHLGDKDNDLIEPGDIQKIIELMIFGFGQFAKVERNP
jgi:hypothetical protein